LVTVAQRTLQVAFEDEAELGRQAVPQMLGHRSRSRGKAITLPVVLDDFGTPSMCRQTDEYSRIAACLRTVD
jgi:hypothetical protein